MYKPWYRIWLKIEKHKKRWNEIQWTNFVYISNVVDRPWRVQTGQCISWCDYNKDITNPLLFIINPTDSVRCLYFIRLSYQKQCKLEENHVSQNEKEWESKFAGKKSIQPLDIPSLTLIRDFDWQRNKSPHFKYFQMYTQFWYTIVRIWYGDMESELSKCVVLFLCILFPLIWNMNGNSITASSSTTAAMVSATM